MRLRQGPAHPGEVCPGVVLGPVDERDGARPLPGDIAITPLLEERIESQQRVIVWPLRELFRLLPGGGELSVEIGHRTPFLGRLMLPRRPQHGRPGSGLPFDWPVSVTVVGVCAGRGRSWLSAGRPARSPTTQVSGDDRFGGLGIDGSRRRRAIAGITCGQGGADSDPGCTGRSPARRSNHQNQLADRVAGLQ